MTHLLLAYISPTQIAQGSPADSTSSTCPLPNGLTCSVTSILSGFALTLEIYVRHAIHVDVCDSQSRWSAKAVGPILSFLFTPERVVVVASAQRWEARDKVIQSRGLLFSTVNTTNLKLTNFGTVSEEGNKRSMTHRFFAEMARGGCLSRPGRRPVGDDGLVVRGQESRESAH